MMRKTKKASNRAKSDRDELKKLSSHFHPSSYSYSNSHSGDSASFKRRKISQAYRETCDGRSRRRNRSVSATQEKKSEVGKSASSDQSCLSLVLCEGWQCKFFFFSLCHSSNLYVVWFTLLFFDERCNGSLVLSGELQIHVVLRTSCYL